MAEFEENFVHRLGITRALTMLRRNLGTMLAYCTPGEQQGSSGVRILNLMGYGYASIPSLLSRF